jgi:hypothetical protein
MARPLTTTSTRHSPTCSTAPSRSPLIPSKARWASRITIAAPSAAASARGATHQPPTSAPIAAPHTTPAAAGRAAAPGVVGAEAVVRRRPCRRHRSDRRASTEGVCRHDPGERRGRAERCDAHDAQHDRGAHRRHAVAAVARVLQDLAASLGRGAAECVGGVGEAVLVERAGDHQSHDDRESRGNCRWQQFHRPGRHQPDGGADERTDHREPRHGGDEVGRLAQPDRHTGEELGCREKSSLIRRTTRRTSAHR